MTFYCEYALQPHLRNGTMIPVESLPEFYRRDDAGYSTHYWFRKEDAEQIRAQRRSKDMGRFSVYTKFLIVDIDREDNMDAATADMRLYTNDLVLMGLKFSVWVSGGKGYHIYIHCEEMEGQDVPFSQAEWVRQRGWKVDMSLYQHGRLLSNPGRKSIRTGIRKHKIEDHEGRLLRVPRVTPPIRSRVDEAIGTSDLARVALFRCQKALESEPSSRHTTLWSLAGACSEAGMNQQTTTDLMRFINSLWKTPKDDAGLVRAIDQAYQQTLMSRSLSQKTAVGQIHTSEALCEVQSADSSFAGQDVLPR